MALVAYCKCAINNCKITHFEKTNDNALLQITFE